MTVRLGGLRRGVAQPGRAPGSGPGGRRFKSSLPDHLFSMGCNSRKSYLALPHMLYSRNPHQCWDFRGLNNAHRHNFVLSRFCLVPLS
jgi:hypothetical protein